MLKRKLCEATFRWELKCEGPLLIRDERYAPYLGEQGGGFPGCIFISHVGLAQVEEIAKNCANAPPKDLPFYVPGTSIRGPLRALVERIIRSLAPEDAALPLTACDPFEQDNEKTLACSRRLETPGEHKSKYAGACPACKLFGCAGLASRIKVTDADISACRSVYRDMIGIDRFTGGVSSGANMRFHVLEGSQFATTVTVTNFELWQLGLLAYVFRDFEMGLVPIGHGKTKGFGQVRGTISEIVLTYPTTSDHIEHMGSLMGSASERAHYGVSTCEAPQFAYFSPISDRLSLYKRTTITDIPAFWETVAPFFNRYIEEMNRQAEEKAS